MVKNFTMQIITLTQVTKSLTPPENVTNYVCKDREVKMHWPKHDQAAGQFLGQYESIGYIIVRGDYEEHFFDYDFCKEKSKLLYYYHKRVIPSFFSGTFFNRHKISYESGSLPTDSSNIYFFYHQALIRSKKLLGIWAL